MYVCKAVWLVVAQCRVVLGHTTVSSWIDVYYATQVATSIGKLNLSASLVLEAPPLSCRAPPASISVKVRYNELYLLCTPRKLLTV